MRRSTTRRGGPPLPSVHLLGTSWYRRGPGYWARRTGLAVVYLLWLALVVVIIAALVRVGVEHTSGPARALVVVVATAAVGWSTTWAFRRRARYWRGELDGGTARSRGAAVGLGAGGAARGGSTVPSLLVFVGAFVAVGWLLTTVVDSFGRYLSVSERDAVADVRDWERHHPA